MPAIFSSDKRKISRQKIISGVEPIHRILAFSGTRRCRKPDPARPRQRTIAAREDICSQTDAGMISWVIGRNIRRIRPVEVPKLLARKKTKPMSTTKKL